jgi:L-ascorbate metabolism protein UlaG (beta-lactamase superfamily)
MLRVAYVGHSTVQLKTGGTHFLTDPVLRPRVAHLRRIVPPPALDGLTEPDAVLISHAHLDHLDPPSLRLLRPCLVIAPRGCGRLLRRAGVGEVAEAVPGESLTVGKTRVTPFVVPHDGRRHPFSRARQTMAYLLDGLERAFFAGDTDLFPGMAEFADGLDLALLPIWGWGPRVGRGHMDPERAAGAAALLRPSVAVPIHWGTLASPRAPWRDDPARPARQFVEQAAARAPGVEVRVLPPGGHTEIAGAAADESEPE